MLLLTYFFIDFPIELLIIIVMWCFAIFLVIYLVYMIIDEVIEPNQVKKKLSKEFKSICDNIRDDLICTRDDLHTIYDKNYTKAYPSFIDFLYELKDRLLRSDGISKSSYYPNEISKIKEYFDNLIKEQNKKEPFSGISDEDRASFMNILQLTEDNDKKALIGQEINRITISIRNYISRIKKESRNNKIALALSVFGIIATAIFYFLGNASLSKENIEEININTKQQMTIVADSIVNSINHNIVINDSTLDESMKKPNKSQITNVIH